MIKLLGNIVCHSESSWYSCFKLWQCYVQILQSLEKTKVMHFTLLLFRAAYLILSVTPDGMPIATEAANQLC